MKRLLLHAAGLLIGGALSAQTAALPGLDDMRQLRAQATEWQWDGTDNLNPSPRAQNAHDEAHRWAAALQPDGSWKDIDYKDQSRGFWKTAAHLKRTLAIAEEATQPASGAPAAELQPSKKQMLNAALRATHYWVSHDFKNGNWWHNQIGVPQHMVAILLLIGDAMNPADKAGALKIVDRATFSLTGQNRAWMAGIIFRKALVTGDAALALQARDTILSELKVTPDEGLQVDWSFHQHGPQQQMGNYGLAFTTEMAAWARMWRGTALALPADKEALLRNFLIKGEALIRTNGALDINGCDRQLFPGSPLQKGAMIDRLLTGMAATDPSHALEYATAAAEGSQPAGGGATVDWNFFRSDMIVHRRPGFYVSVKLCSNRVIGEETVNGENLRGRYMADGATFLYQTSADYRDIFPVWDWRRVPGVTCATSGTTLAPVGKMATDFAGGASDGAYGVEGLDYRRDGVTAKKGWFFFDEGVVCLGAGISGSNARTSVDQRRADGIAETNLGPLGLGVEACSGVTWVLDGSMGYLFAKPTDLSAGTQSQAGSWKDVYSAGSPTPITADIFSIWIDHTAQPGSYAYTMLPGATVEKLNAYTAIPPMEIVSNTPDIQAVRAAGVTEALFYKAGQLKLPNLTISTSAPCALILRNGAISVADPTQKQTSLTITINDREWSSPLPQGDLAGSTVQSTPW